MSDTLTVTTAPTVAVSRAGNRVLWGLQVLAVAVFVIAALPKVTADPTAVAGFAALGFSPAGMVTIGILELLGAVGLLVPRLVGLAALAFIGLMIGAVTATWLTMGAGMTVLPAVVLLLVAVIAWGRRDRTAALVALVRGFRR